MEKLALGCAAVSGFVGVAMGAFAAHGLKGRIDDTLLGVFQTGAHYQLIHALALFGVGLWLARVDSPALRAAAWCFLVGTVIFSGSLYTLALTGVRAWGAVTPIGGVAFLLGWAALAVAAWRS